MNNVNCDDEQINTNRINNIIQLARFIKHIIKPIVITQFKYDSFFIEKCDQVEAKTNNNETDIIKYDNSVIEKYKAKIIRPKTQLNNDNSFIKKCNQLETENNLNNETKIMRTKQTQLYFTKP